MSTRDIETAAPAVTWRDGIHISGTPIWCDALRSRDVCFVSSAHAVPSSRHGQLVATAETLALLAESPGTTRLSVPYGRPFGLGTIRLELIRSGHGLGSASLLAQVAGNRVLYAGAVNPCGGGLGGVADTRPCDTVVLAATYGTPQFRFPAIDDIVAVVTAFALDVVTAGGAAVLLVSSPSKALDVASRLRDRFTRAGHRQLSFFGHRGFYDAVLRLRRVLPELPRIRRYAGRPTVGHVLLWPMQRRATLPELSGTSRVALVSGLALDRDVVAELDVAASFAWSNQADHDRLIEYIDTCGARQVFLTHRHADRLAAAIHTPQRVACALGPPQQMSLF